MMVSHSRLKHTKAFWLFVSPSLILFTVFFLIPLVLSIAFSFTDYDGWKTMNFVGLDNYKAVLKDSYFWSAIGRTIIYTLFSLPFRVFIPLIIAVFVSSRKVAFKSFDRTLIYIPVLLSSLVVGVTINWMFSTEYGLVNFLIQSAGLTPLDWALNSALATFVISFASNWSSVGFNMILYIGGIKSISNEMYEAAEIDGSNARQTFFRITLPLLAPTTFLVFFLSSINLLKEYAVVQGITQGGPGVRTVFIIQYIITSGFSQMQYGYGSAISFIIAVFFAVIAYLQFRISGKGGDTV